MSSPSPEFVRSNGGLLVPKGQLRTREVWTKAEHRLLERARVMVNYHDLTLTLECQHPHCKGESLQPSKQLDGFHLICLCTDRLLQKAF